VKRKRHNSGSHPVATTDRKVDPRDFIERVSHVLIRQPQSGSPRELHCKGFDCTDPPAAKALPGRKVSVCLPVCLSLLSE
jgi:hypothetical protein